jgi:hypothetical protein
LQIKIHIILNFAFSKRSLLILKLAGQLVNWQSRILVAAITVHRVPSPGYTGHKHRSLPMQATSEEPGLPAATGLPSEAASAREQVRLPCCLARSLLFRALQPPCRRPPSSVAGAPLISHLTSPRTSLLPASTAVPDDFRELCSSWLPPPELPSTRVSSSSATTLCRRCSQQLRCRLLRPRALRA